MAPGSFAIFAVALGAACATPGPTTTALVARVLARGRQGVIPYCLGLLIGDLFWLSCALFGIAALIATAQLLFAVIKVLGALFLLYLACRIWTARPTETLSARGGERGRNDLFGGLAVALGNPKTMLFYLALVPAVVPLAELTPGDAAALSLLVTAVYGGVLAGYVLLAERVRPFLIRPGVTRWVMRGSAVVIAATGAVVLFH